MKFPTLLLRAFSATTYEVNLSKSLFQNMGLTESAYRRRL